MAARNPGAAAWGVAGALGPAAHQPPRHVRRCRSGGVPSRLGPAGGPAQINWCRAAARFGRRLGQAGHVAVPLQIIWGRHDAFLSANLAQESFAYCDDGRLTYLEASHWVQHEKAAQVNQPLINFLSEMPV